MVQHFVEAAEKYSAISFLVSDNVKVAVDNIKVTAASNVPKTGDLNGMNTMLYVAVAFVCIVSTGIVFKKRYLNNR